MASTEAMKIESGVAVYFAATSGAECQVSRYSVQ